MKRTMTVLAVCLFAAPLLIQAQDNKEQDKPPVRIALRAGLYFSQFKFTNLPPEYSKPKGDAIVYGGLQLDIPVSHKISIVPELLYALSSVQSYDDLQQLYFDDLSHLLVPVLFKYRLGQVSLMAGPQAEFLLTANGHYAEDGVIKTGDIKDRSYSTFTMSGVIGAEWVFKYRFGIDARYQFGLTNARSENAAALMTEYCDKIKMNAFQAGIFFRFGKKPNVSKK